MIKKTKSSVGQKTYFKGATKSQFNNMLSGKTGLSFDTLKNRMENSVKTCINSNQWENSWCSCSGYMKEDECEHICAFAVENHLCTYPDDVGPNILEVKKKRGRSMKARKALIRQ